jgi:hypothetical protein
MGCRFAFGVGQHCGLLIGPTGADGNEKLVNSHGSVNRNLATVQGLEFHLSNALNINYSKN